MDFFGFFLTVAVLAVLAMVGYTAWTVMKKKDQTPASAAGYDSIRLSGDVGRVDWRVYAVDQEDNCFIGSEIVLDGGKEEFVMGRGEGCDLKLMRPQIGRRHAKVTRRGIVYTYHDLGSQAGSVCNGKKIESKRLEHLMVVWVYDVALVFANCEVQQDFIIRAVKNSRGKNS